jgi:hypothetical protein
MGSQGNKPDRVSLQNDDENNSWSKEPTFNEIFEATNLCLFC